MSLAPIRTLQTLGRACVIAGLVAFVCTFVLVTTSHARPPYYWLFIPLPDPIGRALWHTAPLVLTFAPLVSLVGVLALVRARRLRLALRRAGLCVQCGYDLRGNVSGVCPECGMPVRWSPGA